MPPNVKKISESRKGIWMSIILLLFIIFTDQGFKLYAKT